MGLVLCSGLWRALRPPLGRLPGELPSPFPPDEQKGRTAKLTLSSGLFVAKGGKNEFQSYYLKNVLSLHLSVGFFKGHFCSFFAPPEKRSALCLNPKAAPSIVEVSVY